MIFITVGTQKFQFNRLIMSVDRFLDSGEISDSVFAQIGNSDYIPHNFQYARFLSASEYNKCLDKCDIIISHSGVATIVKGVKAGKKVIAVPRLKDWNEHVDDHQRQIADTFEECNLIAQCVDLKELPRVIDWVKSYKFETYKSQQLKVIDTIEKFLDG